MDRIAVIRAGALGDTVLALPAVRALRRRYPDAHLTAVGYAHLWELAGDLIDERVSIDGAMFSSLFAGAASPPLAAWSANTDLVVAWTSRDPTAALRDAGVPQVIHASPYPPPGVHAAAWLLDTIGASADVPDRLLLPGVSRREQKDYGPIVIHPGAGAEWKRWPAERFTQVADRLRQQGYHVLLLQGPADEDAVEGVQRAASAPLPVAREPALSDLISIFAGARLFIGNDSGVTHLAAATGAPTLTLFGPTDPASWAPLGDVRVLRRCGRTATRQGQIRVCPDPDCMAAIGVEEVLEAVAELLDMNVNNHVDNCRNDVENRPSIPGWGDAL